MATPPNLLQPTQNPPPNFSFVEAGTQIIRADPPRAWLSEININDYEYFHFDDLYGRYWLSNNDLRDLIMKPNVDHPYLSHNYTTGLFMRKKNNYDLSTILQFQAAHLPNINDLVRVTHEGVEVFLEKELSKLDNYDEEIVPTFALYILDPGVKIPKQGKIHLLREAPITYHIGTYTTALECLHVMAKMSTIDIGIHTGVHVMKGSIYKRFKFNKITVEGKFEEDPYSPLFQPHTSLVVWNCKSAARDSFISNFHKMMGLHAPNVVVLLEARCYSDMFASVYARMDTTMAYEVVQCAGISGGIVVMWDSNDAEVEFDVRREGELAKLTCAIKAKEHPSARKRLFAN